MSVSMTCDDQVEVTMESILEHQWRHFHLSAVRYKWREFVVFVEFLLDFLFSFVTSKVRVLLY
jgi:hypothetical protein